MSEETRTDLKTADAFVTVEGILSEKKLEEVVNDDGKRTIKGSVVVKVDDTNFITLNVWVNEVTAKGAQNNAFAGMQTVMNEYQSIAEVGEEAATRVFCKRGQLQPNSYVNKEDLMVHTGVRYSASYLTRVAPDKFSPRAEFEVEAFINTMLEEMDTEGQPTGRLKMGLFVPTYRGIEPLELIIPEEIADAFDSTFERGQTTRIYGKILNCTIVKEKVIKLVVGGERKERSTSWINELQVTGATAAYDEEFEFAAEAIQKALVERDLRLQKEKEVAAEAKKKGSTATPAVSTGRPLPKFSGFANM